MTKTDDTARIRKDAEGQYAKSQADPKANGVASAKPTVITGSDDATKHRDPPGKKSSTPDWDVNFDVGERPRHT